MKYINFVLPILLVGLASCSTAKRNFEKQEYDKVITTLAPKACKNQLNTTRFDLLANAYHKANQRDFDTIMKLKQSAAPDVWPEVYWRTFNIQQRDKMLQCLSAKQKKYVRYNNFNLDEELTFTKVKAEQYLASKSRQLLKSGEKSEALQSLTLLKELKFINPSLNCLSELYPQALMHSADKYTFEFVNPRNLNVPKHLSKIFFNFDNAIPKNDSIKSGIDLKVNVILIEVEASPERRDQVAFTETNENKSAVVTDNTLTKTLTLKGKIVYLNAKTEQVYFMTPFEVSSNFKYNFATVTGDKAACSSQTLELAKLQAIPFPADDSMICDAAKQLNAFIQKTITK